MNHGAPAARWGTRAHGSPARGAHDLLDLAHALQ